MDEHRQTHTVPPDRPARERLARLMGCGTLKEFEAAFQAHTGNVRRLFDKVLKAEKAFGGAPPPFPREFKDAEGEWRELLSRHGFKEVDKALRMLREFVEGPGYVHVSPRTSELALQLLPRLFEMCRVAAGTVGTVLVLVLGFRLVLL